jgi:hypothetical protein
VVTRFASGMICPVSDVGVLLSSEHPFRTRLSTLLETSNKGAEPNPERLTQLSKFHKINTSLPCLKLGHEALWTFESPSQVHLPNPLLLPNFTDERCQSSVFPGVDGRATHAHDGTSQ